MNAVLDHTHSLALYTYNKMSAMKHTSGNPLCKIYCKTDFKNKSQQGPIINFNVLRANGDFVGYSEVLKNCFLYIIKTRLVSHFFQQKLSKHCQSTLLSKFKDRNWFSFLFTFALQQARTVHFSFSTRCCYWAHWIS